MSMVIRTRVFELCNGSYRNLSELAEAMGLSVSQVYRVREGKRGINEKFIIGAKRAFPGRRLDDLFYLQPSPAQALARATPLTPPAAAQPCAVCPGPPDGQGRAVHQGGLPHAQLPERAGRQP